MSEAMTRVGSGHWNDPTTDVLRRSYGNISSNDIIISWRRSVSDQTRAWLKLPLNTTHIKHQKAYISALHQECVCDEAPTESSILSLHLRWALGLLLLPKIFFAAPCAEEPYDSSPFTYIYIPTIEGV
jgi:hypothetical protein